MTCYPSSLGLSGKNATNLGYPGSGLYQYKSAGRVTLVYTNTFRSTSISVDGMSGGPIINSDNNLIGIISGVDGNGSTIGVRITEDLMALIKEVTGL